MSAKHIHILGIGGTFMSALALLAREAGYRVTGCDAHCYPPVSELLTTKGIAWEEGYENAKTALEADYVIVGNAIKRGMPVIEAVLTARKPYSSGPEWLAQHILSRYRVIAVAGTHGKTTTTSMLSYILHYAGFDPGFLIGGVSTDFNTSAHLGKGDWFVIEADEYDTAFFDKRPKFMHYHPTIAILNNLEFDHADIYPDLPAIQQQFHYLLRTIPSDGTIIKPRDDLALNEVLQKGCYSNVKEIVLDQTCHSEHSCPPSLPPHSSFLRHPSLPCHPERSEGSPDLLEIPHCVRDDREARDDGGEVRNGGDDARGGVALEADWQAHLLDEKGQVFEIRHAGHTVATVRWSLMGLFNIENAVAAFVASITAGVSPIIAAKALAHFKPVKRRLEIKSTARGITVYDDFAHHPTAIAKTIQALKNSKRHQRILVVLEFASYTMKTGVHAQKIGAALADVQEAFILNPSHFSLTEVASNWTFPYHLLSSTSIIVDKVMQQAKQGDAILVMSNRGFDHIHQQLISRIEALP